MGSPEFAAEILKGITANYSVSGVVTQPDRPAGRGKQLTPPPVKTLAIELGLPVIQPNRMKDEGVLDQLKMWNPDLIIVAAFGQILRANVLDLPKFGCVNVHASLLPRWRGAAPIQAAILHGDVLTGVTIMKMDQGIDTGDILSQESMKIGADATASTLATGLAVLGSKLLLETLPNYLSGAISPQKQDDTLATYAKMIKKDAGILDLKLPAAELERTIRAFDPWPGASIEMSGQQIKILLAEVSTGKAEPGQRLVINKFPAVGTGDGILLLRTVQVPGKKPMSGRDFLNGFKNWSDD